MANPKNEKSIAELRNILEDTQTFFLVDYQGLSAEELADLRKKVKESGGRLFVTKNTLLSVALKEQGSEGFEEMLKGPTAMVLVEEDPIGPAKAITDYANENPKKLPETKGGILGGKPIDAAAVKKIIDLPPREYLLSSLLGVLQSPLQQLVTSLESPQKDLVTVLEGVPRKFVNLVNNYSEKLKQENN